MRIIDYIVIFRVYLSHGVTFCGDSSQHDLSIPDILWYIL